MTKPLVALVLAGGAGTRFWPLTTSKILMPFVGKRLIKSSIIDLLPKEVSKVVLVTNSENQKTVQGLKFPVPSVSVVQQAPLGTADALLTAAAELRASSLLVYIADDIVEPQLLAAVVKKAKSSQAFGVIPGFKTKNYIPGGYLVLEGNRIRSIKEKPGMGNEPSQYVNVTGHYISDSDKLIAQLTRTRSDTDDVYERALTSLMLREQFEVVPYAGAYASLKYPWNVLDVMEILLGRIKQPYRGQNVKIGNNVTIVEPVVIEDGVRILEHTKIIGPCYIGKHTIIGNHNLIRLSCIGQDCVTGFGTDIARSYIGAGCWFHNNYVGDSVLEENIGMGSGAVLANVRLDEGEIGSLIKGERVNTLRHKLGTIMGKGVRLGVNVSVMPGVKIGSNSFVGAGVVLNNDVPDDSFCVAGSGYTLTQNTWQPKGVRQEFRKQL